MNTRKILRLAVAALLLLVFLFSGWQVFSTLSEYKRGKESYAELTQEYVSEKLPEPQEHNTALKAVSAEPVETEPKETAPISVDFDALLKEYPDVVGWLYGPDTVINYPLLQGEDNQFYLRHLPNGVWDGHGCLYMDYRCAPDFSSWNSIIYGHDMQNGSMFGTLDGYYEQAYYEEHPYLYLLTPAMDYKILLISSYITPSTDEVTYSIPYSREERDTLVEKAIQDSSFKADVEVGDDDKLIAFSTCAYVYSGARHIVLGVLQELAPFAEGGGIE